MKNKSRKAKKISGIWTMIVIPTLTLAAVGGAIYYVVKNSKSIQKEFWSVEKFNESVKNIKISSEIIGSLEAKNLYNDFQNQKSVAKKRIDAFYEKYPNLKDKKVFSYEDKQILKNKPQEFDANSFLKTKIDTNLDFEKTKFLDFRFTDLTLINGEDSKLKVHFEVFLNYEYARGTFELNKIKSTPNSKYYFKSSQDIIFLSNSLKTYPGSKFYNEWSENKQEAEQIIKKYDNINKNLETKIIKLDERQKELTSKENRSEEENEELKSIHDEIQSLKLKQSQTFESEEFRKEIFDWFEKILDKTDAFQDIYPKDDFKIVPFIQENIAYVIWNPKKGLNELTIKYIFVHKNNKDIKSDGEIKIFTLDV
ncbi:hypothetical protein [Metamycoplasma gateae]|uniref:Uncharacterized protein n=1 Tax=Metamycoplasma gateae TaxID=35769 RepID=A0ABZ2AHJ4_9BACT|nr:hypothetical protein V2E26_01175 [Metamycoplasma gateae]